jgi:hypothetical protein
MYLLMSNHGSVNTERPLRPEAHQAIVVQNALSARPRPRKSSVSTGCWNSRHHRHDLDHDPCHQPLCDSPTRVMDVPDHTPRHLSMSGPRRIWPRGAFKGSPCADDVSQAVGSYSVTKCQQWNATPTPPGCVKGWEEKGKDGRGVNHAHIDSLALAGGKEAF